MPAVLHRGLLQGNQRLQLTVAGLMCHVAGVEQAVEGLGALGAAAERVAGLRHGQEHAGLAALVAAVLETLQLVAHLYLCLLQHPDGIDRVALGALGHGLHAGRVHGQAQAVRQAHRVSNLTEDGHRVLRGDQGLSRGVVAEVALRNGEEHGGLALLPRRAAVVGSGGVLAPQVVGYQVRPAAAAHGGDAAADIAGARRLHGAWG
mmetsp:Transcript_19264/g.55914  ORF Transcript_19264/g.55914 Transcript_19264/m.55914 type:complete len:205 (+) Transcript_19264:1682-2296(+)